VGKTEVCIFAQGPRCKVTEMDPILGLLFRCCVDFIIVTILHVSFKLDVVGIGLIELKFETFTPNINRVQKRKRIQE
jgi:hypothetical protein